MACMVPFLGAGLPTAGVGNRIIASKTGEGSPWRLLLGSKQQKSSIGFWKFIQFYKSSGLENLVFMNCALFILTVWGVRTR